MRTNSNMCYIYIICVWSFDATVFILIKWSDSCINYLFCNWITGQGSAGFVCQAQT